MSSSIPSSVVIKARITTALAPQVGGVVQGQANGHPIRTSMVTAVQAAEGGWLVSTRNSVYFVAVG